MLPQLKLALCCLALCLLFCAPTTGAKYYVVPTNSSENSSSPECHTLGYYAAHKTEYFTTNSTFLFFPGEHLLNNGDNITVTGASRLRLIATSHSMYGHSPRKGDVPQIDCKGNTAGFAFISVSDLEIRGLSIKGCGQELANTESTGPNNAWYATLGLVNVTHFRLTGTNISGSNGYGVLGQGVYGNSSIEGCILQGNRGKRENSSNIVRHGGNVALHYNHTCPAGVSHFTISHTKILDGYSVSYGGGIDLILSCRKGSINFDLNVVHLFNNTGSNGSYKISNFGIQILAFPDSANSNKISLNDCFIGNTEYKNGSGMEISIYINSSDDELPRKSNGSQIVLEVKGSRFANNTFEDGSTVHMRLYDSADITRHQVGIMFSNTIFKDNKFKTEKLQQSSGVAVDIVQFRAGGSSLHSSPQFETEFNSCNFSNNNIWNHPSLGSGALYVEEHSHVVLENCTISDNNCSGIAAVHSNLIFREKNVIMRNKAVHGGGILLADNAVMFLTENTTILIENNNATETGGGIYAEYGITTAIPLCFFQFNTSTLLSDTKLKTIKVCLYNNSANTGKAVYGGHVDVCYFLVHNIPWINKQLLSVSSGKIFNETFKYNHTDKTAISSDALKVCFCEDDTALCNNKTKHLRKSPGESFNIYVMVVGQRQGKTDGIVIAQFFNNKNSVHLGKNEETAKVNHSCMSLSYTVYSSKENFTTNLSLNVPESTYRVGYPVVQLHVTRCPMGFVIDNTSYSCDCVKILNHKGVRCSPENHTIQRPSGLWIGYNTHNKSQNIIVHRCPRLFCKPTTTYIKAYQDDIDQDSQCYLNRSGLLCGQCQHGQSIVFGTPRCVYCRNYSHWVALGMTCAFALAGLLLVVFLIVFNFTVTEGTINGFILYANIVEACQDTYFPLRAKAITENYIYTFLRTFIAWLNLDLGIQACFYNGMTTFDKTFLQFVFPIYIWLITGLLIWLSRRSTLVTRLLKNNGTKVLATLILLSYTKLIRAIETCLVGVYVDSHLLWYYDASEPYFNGKHILLFLTAVVFIVVLLPYTLALLFIKHLPRLTSLGMFHWLHKLKPLFDAYTGPYTDEYRFWVGLQLVVRVAILCSVSLPTDNILLLLLIIAACTILLSANYFYGSGIYKKRSVNIIEALLLLNLTLWSIVSIYNQNNSVVLHNHVFIFVGFMFLQFWVVVIYFHVCKPVFSQNSQGRYFQKLSQLGLACRRSIKNVVMCRCTRRHYEHTCLLENSVTYARATYDELSEPTSSSFQSATDEICP